MQRSLLGGQSELQGAPQPRGSCLNHLLDAQKLVAKLVLQGGLGGVLAICQLLVSRGGLRKLVYGTGDDDRGSGAQLNTPAGGYSFCLCACPAASSWRVVDQKAPELRSRSTTL